MGRKSCWGKEMIPEFGVQGWCLDIEVHSIKGKKAIEEKSQNFVQRVPQTLFPIFRGARTN